MTLLRHSVAALTLGAGLVASTAADAVVLRGCADYRPFPPLCLMMKASDGKTYQLLEAGPAFPPGRRVLVYGDKVGDVGICFAPTVRVIRFRVQPGPC